MKKPILALVMFSISVALAQNAGDVYPYPGRTLLLAPEVMQTGTRYAMNDHFITLNPDGNFVVAREADDGYVWGFDSVGVDYPQVARVEMQRDGNLAAYDANGSYIWSALTENPDPNARLILTPTGALLLYSDERGVLWSSNPDDTYPYPGRTLLLAPEVMQTGTRYAMNDHFITLNPDGNFVVAREADDSYVWGFDSVGVDYPQVARVEMQSDGNLAAYDANGSYIWSALTENPDPDARLILTPTGALQLYSDERGVLWSSDGNF